jgi:hypothetical protein
VTATGTVAFQRTRPPKKENNVAFHLYLLAEWYPIHEAVVMMYTYIRTWYGCESGDGVSCIMCSRSGLENLLLGHENAS